MGWQLTPYTIPLIVAALVGTGFGTYVAWIYRREGRHRSFLPLAVTMFATGWWAAAHALQLSSTTVAGKYRWLRVLHLAPVVIPTSFLVFALLYAGYDRWVTRRTLAAFAVEPLVTLAVVWTNPIDGGLMWSSVGPVAGDGAGTLVRSFGPWYLFNVAYSYVLLTTGMAALVVRFLDSDRLYRRQAAVFVLAAGIPLATHASFMLGVVSVNFTSLAYIATGVALTVAVVRYRLFDVVPVARETVIETMRDGYVVLDTGGRIVDFNDTAEDVLAELQADDGDGSPLGADVGEFFPEVSIDESPDAAVTPDRTEVVLDGDDHRVVTVAVDPLSDDDRLVGYLLHVRDVTERQQVERRYGTLIEEASDLFVVLDADTTVTYGSPSIERILGVDPERVEGRRFLDRVHPDDRSRLREVIDASLEEPERRLRVEFRIHDAEGDYRTFDGVCRNLLAEPTVEGIVVNAHDVTERKAREEKLQRYETIVEAVGDPVYTLDEDRTLTFVNEALVEMTGYPEEVLVGSDAQLLMDPADIERGDRLIADLVHGEDRTRGTFEMDVLTRDGERIPVENNVALLGTGGELGGTAGVLRDITERKAREEELQQFETIMNSLADPVWVTDAEGDATYVNPAFEDRVGYSEGVNFTDVLPGSDVEKTREAIRRLLSSESDAAREIVDSELLTADGRRIPVENHMSLLPFEEEFRGAAGVLRDVSEQRRRREVMDVMNRVLRHNLRTHVNSIVGYTGMVQPVVDDPEAGYLRQVEESARWLGTLGETLRDLQGAFEQERRGRTSLDVVDLVAETVDSVRSSYPRAEVDTHLPAEAVVEAGGALRYALEQVVENAVVHHDGDHPEVHVTLTPAPEDGWVDLRVEDDGPGIPRAERSLVTGEVEITQLQHGSGLGLWVTRWIIEAFDGELLFEDNDPRGTVVVMRLRRSGESRRSVEAITQ